MISVEVVWYVSSHTCHYLYWRYPVITQCPLCLYSTHVSTPCEVQQQLICLSVYTSGGFKLSNVTMSTNMLYTHFYLLMYSTIIHYRIFENGLKIHLANITFPINSISFDQPSPNQLTVLLVSSNVVLLFYCAFMRLLSYLTVTCTMCHTAYATDTAILS